MTTNTYEHTTSDHDGIEIGEPIAIRTQPGASPNYELADRAVEMVAEAEGDLTILMQNVGATPWFRPTPYENNDGVLVKMWSCISIYPKACPGRTYLFGRRKPVWPDEHEGYNVRIFTKEWIKHEVRRGGLMRPDREVVHECRANASMEVMVPKSRGDELDVAISESLGVGKLRVGQTSTIRGLGDWTVESVEDDGNLLRVEITAEKLVVHVQKEGHADLYEGPVENLSRAAVSSKCLRLHSFTPIEAYSVESY
jgi:hypothetical protein